MVMTGSGEIRTARDGRRWTLRPGRPTDGRALARLFAEADGDVIGNLLVSVDRGVATEHIGVLSITIADGWRDVGIGSELVAGAQAWASKRALRKLSLGVFPDNHRAIAVYEKRGFVREGVRRMQYRTGNEYRDEVL